MTSFSSLQDLAARRIVRGHIVTIPGLKLSTLSEADRRALGAIIEELEENAPSLSLDLDAVNEKLLDHSREESPFITPPPPSHEEMLALAQKEEQQSSNALLVAGCPPCYPIDAVFPLPKDAEEYEAVSYFNSLPGSTGHEPLTPSYMTGTHSLSSSKQIDGTIFSGTLSLLF